MALCTQGENELTTRTFCRLQLEGISKEILSGFVHTHMVHEATKGVE